MCVRVHSVPRVVWRHPGGAFPNTCALARAVAAHSSREPIATEVKGSYNESGVSGCDYQCSMVKIADETVQTSWCCRWKSDAT